MAPLPEHERDDCRMSALGEVRTLTGWRRLSQSRIERLISIDSGSIGLRSELLAYTNAAAFHGYSCSNARSKLYTSMKSARLSVGWLIR